MKADVSREAGKREKSALRLHLHRPLSHPSERAAIPRVYSKGHACCSRKVSFFKEEKRFQRFGGMMSLAFRTARERGQKCQALLASLLPCVQGNYLLNQLQLLTSVQCMEALFVETM